VKIDEQHLKALKRRLVGAGLGSAELPAPFLEAMVDEIEEGRRIRAELEQLQKDRFPASQEAWIGGGA
jgi:hypothetical protein